MRLPGVFLFVQIRQGCYDVGIVLCLWERGNVVVSVLLVLCCLRICVIEECWRQPVETQDFASPDEISAMGASGYMLLTVALLACETQDFASLLWGASDIM